MLTLRSRRAEVLRMRSRRSGGRRWGGPGGAGAGPESEARVVASVTNLAGTGRYGYELKFMATVKQPSRNRRKPRIPAATSARGFRPGGSVLRAGLYARVSTHDQQTLPMQLSALRDYVQKRGWTIAVEIKDVGSGASLRPRREELLMAARRREIDLVLVLRLDRWGRSLVDLVTTLQELVDLGVGFVSLSEALDMTTPSGRALAGMLAVFAEFERDILRDRVKAGIAQARKEGRPHGRPPTVARFAPQIKALVKKGMSKREIAKRLRISRSSVRRLLRPTGVQRTRRQRGRRSFRGRRGPRAGSNVRYRAVTH